MGKFCNLAKYQLLITVDFLSVLENMARLTFEKNFEIWQKVKFRATLIFYQMARLK